MKISKFPIFSLILLAGATIYAVIFCSFEVPKTLLDGRSKVFIRNTMTTFLNDLEKAKTYKAREISDESLVQMHDFFRSKFGQCQLKDISMLKGFQINSSMALKTYIVTVDCEKRKDMSITVTVRQKNDEVKYFGLKGDF